MAWNSNMPGRVEAAMRFLDYARCKEKPQFEQWAASALSSGETAAQKAAERVLIQYLNGEMDYGDESPRCIDGDDPEELVPVDV